MTADSLLITGFVAGIAFTAGVFAGRWPWRGWRTWPQFRTRKGRLWVRMPDNMDKELK